MQHNGWDHALKVTADGKGLVGHAGAILLRKAADQAGLTGLLSGALKEKRTSPLIDRGIVLVSMAAAIALGATSMSDIALLAHLAPLLGAAPSGPTVRRALDLAGTPRMLDRIARARAKARAHAWALIAATVCGVPLAGRRGEGPRRLDRHRHGRDPGHRPFSTRKEQLPRGRKGTVSTLWGPGAGTRESASPCCSAPAVDAHLKFPSPAH